MLAGTHLKNLVVHGVGSWNDLFVPAGGNPDDAALAGVELHLPGVFPFLKGVDAGARASSFWSCCQCWLRISLYRT